IKDSLTKLVLDYEVTQRKIYFLKNSYMVEFAKLLEEKLYLEYENKYMVEAISKKDEIDSIETLLEENKKSFETILNSFHKEIEAAKDLERRCRNYDIKDMENLDQEFMDFCIQHHPVLKGRSSMNERSAFSSLCMVYRMGNIAGFRNLLNETKELFTLTTINEEEYEPVAKLYQDSYRNLTSLMAKQKSEFPLNRENLFQSSEEITKEYGLLRQSNYDLRQMNKAIHKDFTSHFNIDFTL
ncbi:MAG: hypothetical protein K2O05_00900, partial [Anaeroplasmataceae bacterium]|nr:hypothetical protein [Anaeroplasmataceae bacterium]